MKKIRLFGVIAFAILAMVSCNKLDPSTNLGANLLLENNLLVDNNAAFSAQSLQITVDSIYSDTIPGGKNGLKWTRSLGSQTMKIGYVHGEKLVSFARFNFNSFKTNDTAVIIDSIQILLGIDSVNIDKNFNALLVVRNADDMSDSTLVKETYSDVSHTIISSGKDTRIDPVAKTIVVNVLDDLDTFFVNSLGVCKFTKDSLKLELKYTFAIDSIMKLTQGVLPINSAIIKVSYHQGKLGVPQYKYSDIVNKSYSVFPSGIPVGSIISTWGSARMTCMKLDFTEFWKKALEGDSGRTYENFLDVSVRLPIDTLFTESDSLKLDSSLLIDYALLPTKWEVTDTVGRYFGDTLNDTYQNQKSILFSLVKPLSTLQSLKPNFLYLYLLVRHAKGSQNMIRVDWKKPVDMKIPFKVIASNLKK